MIRFKESVLWVCVYVYDFLLATYNGQTSVLLLLDATAASTADHVILI